MATATKGESRAMTPSQEMESLWSRWWNLGASRETSDGDDAKAYLLQADLNWQDALDATDMDDMVRSIRDARICMRTARQYMDQA